MSETLTDKAALKSRPVLVKPCSTRVSSGKDPLPDSHSKPTMAAPEGAMFGAAAGLITPPAPAVKSDESKSSTRPSLPTVAWQQQKYRSQKPVSY